jgi:hypothetical protein
MYKNQTLAQQALLSAEKSTARSFCYKPEDCNWMLPFHNSNSFPPVALSLKKKLPAFLQKNKQQRENLFFTIIQPCFSNTCLFVKQFPLHPCPKETSAQACPQEHLQI